MTDKMETYKALKREQARQELVKRAELEQKRKADECVRKFAQRQQDVISKK